MGKIVDLGRYRKNKTDRFLELIEAAFDRKQELTAALHELALWTERHAGESWAVRTGKVINHYGLANKLYNDLVDDYLSAQEAGL